MLGFCGYLKTLVTIVPPPTVKWAMQLHLCLFPVFFTKLIVYDYACHPVVIILITLVFLCILPLI